MRPKRLELALPSWTAGWLRGRNPTPAAPEERMDLAVALARRNVEEGTGGPFGAAVFERASGRLVAIGVNAVLATGCSHAHAELMALGLAQRRLRTHDLGAAGLPAHELATSAEPCGMCLGAVVWSGVRSLLVGARDEDVRAIGFDEGPKPLDWVAALESRGIAVTRDVARDAARAVLLEYRRSGGPIYGPRR